MSRKPQPITLARIAADIIHGATIGVPAPTLKEQVRRALPSEVAEEVEAQLELATPLTLQVDRYNADAIGQRISDAWGMLKAHDSTGSVVIQENAEGLWYAIWRDHAGVVIAESTPVTTAEQAGKLVAWMRDNAVAAPEEIVEGKFAEAQALAATAPTTAPPGLEHLAPSKPEEATDAGA